MTLLEGDHELRPGLTVHLIGGHTRGTQVVRVHTVRGWIVLACDCVHYYDNIAERNPFPAVVDVEQVLDGYERIEALADSAAHIVPGHDPSCSTRYEAERDGIALLHRTPPTCGSERMIDDPRRLAQFRESVTELRRRRSSRRARWPARTSRSTRATSHACWRSRACSG